MLLGTNARWGAGGAKRDRQTQEGTWGVAEHHVAYKNKLKNERAKNTERHLKWKRIRKLHSFNLFVGSHFQSKIIESHHRADQLCEGNPTAASLEVARDAMKLKKMGNHEQWLF